MDDKEEKRRILEIIDTYAQAFEEADADLMKNLFWVDDPRFVEVENHLPDPFGRERFLAIMDWIREHQERGWQMEFYDTKVHILSSQVAYSISMRDTRENEDTETSRVTLVFLKKGNEWKIIHGHFSNVPG